MFRSDGLHGWMKELRRTCNKSENACPKIKEFGPKRIGAMESEQNDPRDFLIQEI